MVLLRIENTRAGDDHTVFIDRWDPETGRFQGERQPGGQGTTYVWLEDEVALGTGLHFGIAETENLPFSITIPAQMRPTFATPQGSVTWKVGVLLSRSGVRGYSRLSRDHHPHRRRRAERDPGAQAGH